MKDNEVILRQIGTRDYSRFRDLVIFECCKWDPQIGDVNSISDHIAVLSPECASQLNRWSEGLYHETMAIEKELMAHPELWKTLNVPPPIIKALARAQGRLPDNAINVMRFDFHPTDTGWALTEVNRDVPGGFAEASRLPELAAPYCDGVVPFKNNATDVLCSLLLEVCGQDKPVAMVYCTSYTDDQQVMEFIARQGRKRGLTHLFVAPDHLRFTGAQVDSIALGHEGPVGAMVRFYPVEWLAHLDSTAQWHGFFEHTVPAANHATAILAQSKRIPLLWDRLACSCPLWKALLPPTRDPATNKIDNPSSWIYKPALGRVGEGISISDVLTAQEMRAIEKSVRRSPGEWIIQKRFVPRKLSDQSGKQQHLCIGVFVINGIVCGYYGRISDRPRIDSYAKDIAVVITGENGSDE